MNTLQNYLNSYYQTADELAAACSISAIDFATLVSDKLVPEASYSVLDGDRFVSQAFGEFHAEGLTPGQYYHPGNATWIALAIEVKTTVGAGNAYQVLQERFQCNFASALEELDSSIFRLPDSFTDIGEVRSLGLSVRTESAWGSFLKGVFSLCVADRSSEKSIARKEILQEAITELTNGGAKADFSGGSRRHILELIDQYAQAAMPFSPIEYPSSSRKRLVEDLRAKLEQLSGE